VAKHASGGPLATWFNPPWGGGQDGLMYSLDTTNPAVVEHLHRDPARGPRTLFATHYQELTQLEKHLPRLRNFSVAVKEWNDDIVFVRRVIPGPADRSYGIQVARLAGLPLSVIERAKTILVRLESDDSSVTLPTPAPMARPKKTIASTTSRGQNIAVLLPRSQRST